MNPQISILKASLKRDQQEIERIYQELEGYGDQPNDPKAAIVMGYYLHNLYCAFENICLNVARTFENQIEDLSQRHAALLKGFARICSVLRCITVWMNCGGFAMYFAMPIRSS